jgi:hypothetical protein
MAALFAGFFAIIAATQHHFESASIAIFIAMIWDALDGRVARLTHTQSKFGAEFVIVVKTSSKFFRKINFIRKLYRVEFSYKFVIQCFIYGWGEIIAINRKRAKAHQQDAHKANFVTKHTIVI